MILLHKYEPRDSLTVFGHEFSRQIWRKLFNTTEKTKLRQSFKESIPK
jgi:hypothetical protein